MLPQDYDLSIYRGDTFTLTTRFREKTVDGQAGNVVDLTGAAGKAQVRASDDDTVVLAEMTVTIDADNYVTLELTPTQTGALPAGVFGVWDFQMTFADGRVRTYLRGSVTGSKDTTRA